VQLCIGRVARGHGVRGQVLIDVRTDDPDDRFAVGSVLVTDPVERGPLVVETSARVSGKLVLGVAGIPDREAADGLRGTLLLVDSTDLPPLPDEDAFHDHDLIGLRASSVDGTDLGSVSDVLHGTGGETLVLHRDGRDVLVPFVRAIVPTVDLAGGRVVVDPPAGLLDLTP